MATEHRIRHCDDCTSPHSATDCPNCGSGNHHPAGQPPAVKAGGEQCPHCTDHYPAPAPVKGKGKAKTDEVVSSGTP